MLMVERTANVIAVPVVAPVPVMGDTVAAKNIAAGKVKSFKYKQSKILIQ